MLTIHTIDRFVSFRRKLFERAIGKVGVISGNYTSDIFNFPTRDKSRHVEHA